MTRATSSTCSGRSLLICNGFLHPRHTALRQVTSKIHIAVPPGFAFGLETSSGSRHPETGRKRHSGEPDCSPLRSKIEKEQKGTCGPCRTIPSFARVRVFQPEPTEPGDPSLHARSLPANNTV